MSNGDTSAMPVVENLEFGLTKREYFAGLAMQGLIPATISEGRSDKEMAIKALEMVDALLAALEQSNEG